MKFALVSVGGSVRIGLLTPRGMKLIDPAWVGSSDPERMMASLIDRFEDIRDELRALEQSDAVEVVWPDRFLAPLPRPGKILSCLGNLRASEDIETTPSLFIKSSGTVIGTGDAIRLPAHDGADIFVADASVATVLKTTEQAVDASSWRAAVFGYTAVFDVTARTATMERWKPGTCIGACFDTFLPMAPYIVTADQSNDLANIHVEATVGNEVRQSYKLRDMRHQLPDLVALAARVMTLNSGDLLILGGDPYGHGPIQSGDELRLTMSGLGTLHATVEDPLGRSWDRTARVGRKAAEDGIFLGYR
jgi:2-keto-4-pentenoate hydratase/2-oxohepta-3-ene-1,7-dioic acid hydratase in catechol pathway